MSQPSDAPVLLGFVADLMLTTRIEAAANRLGYRAVWIDRADDFAPQPAPVETEPPPAYPTEPLKGPEALLIEQITRLRPALMVFDLGNAAIPWREWLALIKSAPATRRYPVVCFGPHVAAEALQAARSAGADAALPRSRFFEDLPGLIERYARRIDRAALQDTCQAPLSAKALHGLDLFNQGEYFEAHEWLETAWNEDQSLGRDLYRGILQVAVAYLHIQRGNYNGALKMFLRMRQWLEPLPDTCRGVDIARLRRDAAEAHAHLLALGPEQIAQFDRRLFRAVVYRPQTTDDR